MNKILVYVQHLLGVGHLHRTALITQALSACGYHVTLVSGGMPEPTLDFGKVDFIQLAPIKTDANFSALYDQNNNPINEEFKQSRVQSLLHTFFRLDPDFVLIETYPFGRRQMRFELLPLLETIKSRESRRPIVASSIRDVIQPKSNSKRNDEIVDLVDRYFDIIFVHGDEGFIKFSQTFPLSSGFKSKLVYTGYVAKHHDLKHGEPRSDNKILISAGGGAVGQKLYQTVIEASQQSSSQDYVWHLLVGNNFSNSEFEKLLLNQNENLIIERNRNDFLELLSNCKVSVSQAGYNTIMDLLVTQTPAVLVPFEGVGEKEQLIRANALVKYSGFTIIREKDLNAASIFKALEDIRQNNSKPLNIRIDGAQRLTNYISRIKSN